MAGVGLELQRAVVLPRDANACGDTHDRRSAERPALIARRIVGGKVPAIGYLAALGVERHARIIALRRCHHPPSPVLGDDRDPLTGEVDRRGGTRSWGWAGLTPSSRSSLTSLGRCSSFAAGGSAPLTTGRGPLSSGARYGQSRNEGEEIERHVANRQIRADAEAFV